MKNNETKIPLKCMDPLYLILTSIYFFGVLGLSIYSLNMHKLHELSMPVDSKGHPCYQTSTPYLQITGPHISDRQCTAVCQQSQPDIRMGGICIDERVTAILKYNGQYTQYIESKLAALSRFKVIGIAIGWTFGAVLLLFVIIQTISKYCSSSASNIFIIGLSIVAGLTAWFVLFQHVGFMIWIALLVAFLLYFLYIIVWRILRSHNSISQLSTQTKQSINNTLCIRVGLVFVFSVLTVGFFSLLVFQYLCMISTSPHYAWKSPALYPEVNALTYKEILVIINGLYLISFTTTLYEYFVGGLHAHNQGFKLVMKRFIFVLGSICKLALIRLLLCFPIFILTLIKPLQSQKCADPCHCLCGLLLNLSRRYSLPILAYQSSIRQPLSLSQCSQRVHYQIHIHSLQFSCSYIQRLALLVIVASIAVGSVLIICTVTTVQDNILTLGLAVVLAVWIGWYFGSSHICAKQAVHVRRVSQANRQRNTQVY